jgi:hypothetical protein
MIVQRGSGFYQYAAVRVAGRPRSKYLGRIDRSQADDMRRAAARERARGKAEAERVRTVESEARALLGATAPLDGVAEALFRTMMHLLGYWCHNRSEWRRRAEGMAMASPEELFGPLTARALRKAEGARPPKRVRGLIEASSAEPEIARVLEAGARGEEAALEKAKALFARAPEVCEQLGDLRWMSELGILHLAAGTDEALRLAVKTRLRARVRELAGPDASAAEYLAAVRASHNAAIVSALETMMLREGVGSKSAEAIDRALGRAERRLHQAMRSLAMLRRLRGPAVKIQQLNVGGAVKVVNGKGGKGKKSLGGRSRPARLVAATVRTGA